MKNILILGILMTSHIVFSQSTKLETYETRKDQLKSQIKTLNDSLSKIELEITKIKSDKILKNIKHNPILGIAKIKAKLKDKPDVVGEVILELKEETPIQILDLIGSYYEVCLDEKCGYMSEMWVKRSDKLKEFRKLIKQREANKEQEELEKRIRKAKIEREREAIAKKETNQKMLKKYGKKNFDKMKEGYFWIGMNKEMLTFSLGEPDNINKTVGSWGTHEQWIYDNGLYIYLENGKVTSYQN